MSKSFSTSISSSSRKYRVNTLSTLISITLLIICLFKFYLTTLPNTKIFRWELLLTPIIDSNFFNEIWFGINLPNEPFTGERLIAFGLGVFFITIVFVVSNSLFGLINSKLGLNKIESLFFGSGIGLIFCSALIFWLSFFNCAKFHVLPICTIIVPVSLIIKHFLISYFQKKKFLCYHLFLANQAVQTTFSIKKKSPEKLVIVFQLILVTIFGLFYLFAATQPIFEYDAVEYHLQGAREIYESGGISFSSNNVYTNMPLGAEMFYVVGFNLVRDIGFNHDNILRLGSLVGKTIITSFVFLTSLGLFTLSIRLFHNISVALWASVVYLSLPGVFEVYFNGLNDGLLGFVTLAIFYLFVLRIQQINSILTSPPKVSRNLLYPILGCFIGFAFSIKYTGVVFVGIPTLIVLVLIEWNYNRSHNFFISGNLQDKISSQPVFPSESFGALRQPRKNLSVLTALLLVLAVSLLFGSGWYIRNISSTGNPVYPLAYSLFGDSTGCWNDSIDKRWKKVHYPHNFDLRALSRAVSESFCEDSMVSPFFLFYGIVAFPIVILGKNKINENDGKRNMSTLNSSTISLLRTVSCLTIIFWCIWFLFTHRLARFLLPITPFIALFLGENFVRNQKIHSKVVRSIYVILILLNFLYSGIIIDFLGQGRVAPLRSLERDITRFSPESIYLNICSESSISNEVNNLLSPKISSKLLLVGEAKAFMYRIPILYSTCWNDSPLVEILADSVNYDSYGMIAEVTNPRRVLQKFHFYGIKYILVDFSELSRFRSKGNYGFNNTEITKDLFHKLLKCKIIRTLDFQNLNIESFNNVQLFEVRE